MNSQNHQLKYRVGSSQLDLKYIVRRTSIMFNAMSAAAMLRTVDCFDYHFFNLLTFYYFYIYNNQKSEWFGYKVY